jgi:hypothetical protein
LEVSPGRRARAAGYAFMTFTGLLAHVVITPFVLDIATIPRALSRALPACAIPRAQDRDDIDADG